VVFAGEADFDRAMWNAATTCKRRHVLPALLTLVVAAAISQPTLAAAKVPTRTSPSGLTVTQTTATSLTLAWLPAANSSGYVVYLNGSRVAKTQSLSYVFGNLVCGTRYTLGVDSYQASGRRSRDVSVAATTASCSVGADTTPPGMPTNLALSSATATSVSLAWTASSDNVGVTAYNLYVNDSMVGTTTSTSYGFGSLKCGTSYTLAVNASDAAGNISQSASVQAATLQCPDTIHPTTPTLLTQSGSTATSISLSWTASLDNVGVAGYGMYVNGSKVATTTWTTATFSGLACGKSYTLGVDAYDAAGNHSPQASVIASTAPCAGAGPDTQPPTTPSGLSPGPATATSLSLTWSASRDNVSVAGYSVYLNGNKVGTTSPTAFTFGNLACATAYTLGVEAFDPAGNVSQRASIPATTSACSGGTSSTVRCDKTAQPGLGTAQALLESLAPGQVGCLHGGTYSGVSTQKSFSSMTTIRSYPGESATIQSSGTVLQADQTAANITFSNLKIVGTGGGNTVYLGGTNIVVSDSEITNNRAGDSCVILGDHIYGEQIGGGLYRNRIHDCGASSHTNQDHCIYSQYTSGDRISGNTIYNCQAEIIQFYPDAHGTSFDHNTTDGGVNTIRGGVLFGSASSHTTTNVDVHDNIITYAVTHGVETSWEGSVGSGNTAHDNCFLQNAQGDFGTVSGYTQYNNLHADPLFTDRVNHNYTLQAGSPCAGKGAP
jgi:chitodextrinase